MNLFHPAEKWGDSKYWHLKRHYKLKRKFREMLKDVVCIAKTSYFELVS